MNDTHEPAELRYQRLNQLADRVAARHWHVSDLPWNDLPALPVPPDVDPRRRRAFVEFGKRAIDVQLAAEHVAVSAAHHLLNHAARGGMHPAVTRALAAVLNDEASHVVVMLELRTRAARDYPDVSADTESSPLFAAFLAAIPRLHPSVIAIAMGVYEAMIAIRSYTEEAAYRHPSILGRMADLAAHDDTLHARILGLVGHVLVDELRAASPDAAGRELAVREHVIDPLFSLWPLLVDHERFLLPKDDRFRARLDRRLAADAVIVRRLLASFGVKAPELQGTAAVRD